MNASWNGVIIISVQNYRLLWFISIKPILKEISDLTFSFNYFHNIWEIQRNIFFQVLLLLNLVEELYCQHHNTTKLELLHEDRYSHSLQVVADMFSI